MKLRTGIVALAAAGLVLAGCSSSSDSGATGGDIESPSADASGTLKIWLMDLSQPQSVVDAVNDTFTETYPNVDVQVELQQWGGIQDKLTTSLGTNSTPDVVEIGNSLTAKFADAGLLAMLDPTTFGVEGMLPGLQPSGELDGERYGIPYYGGVRIVVYKKSDFEAAGVEEPTSLAELNDVAAALQEANADNSKYSAFYFPGKYWYGAVPFVWDAGGDIAVQDGDTWTGSLDSAESKAGLTTLKDLVDTYSKAPKDGDETKNVDAFKTGNVGMMIDSWWAPGALDAGDMKGDIGAFPLPGTDAGTTAPVFFGGSDLTVSEKSANKGLAVEWVKILTGIDIQTQLAREGGVIPNQEAAFVGHEGQEFLLVADEASKNSKFTPVSPNWGNVESSGVLQDMLVKIFTGKSSIDDATAEASEAITSTLNG